MGYKSVDLIRYDWKRFVLIVKPLQFHYSPVSQHARWTGQEIRMEWWSSLSKLSSLNIGYYFWPVVIAFMLTALFAFAIWVVGKQMVVL